MGISRRGFLSSSALLGVASAYEPIPLLAHVPSAPNGRIKVTKLETIVLKFETSSPISDAIHTFKDRGGVVLKVHTDAGITGWGYSYFGTIAGGPKVLKAIIDEELAPVVVGRDPFFTKKIRADLWRATEYHGVTGVVQFGIAAIDIALWDICGKALNQPVYKILGAYRDAVPAYAMVGWYFKGGLSEFRDACAKAIDEGFRAVKIKVGRGDLDEDIKRIEVAKDAVGKGNLVMVDANQVFNLNEALRRGRVYQRLGCYWYEEPLPPHEKDGYAELAAQLDIRIATGENEYTRYAFLELLKKRAVDVVQPDNRRAGGVTEWMEIAALADAFGVSVASHGGGPTNLHMLCAMPNAIFIESGSLKNERTYKESLRLVNGSIPAPQNPGMGSKMRDDFIAKNRVG